METSTNVKIWKTEIYRGKKATSYYVRWRVEKQSYREPRSTKTLAEAFRSQLVIAASKGEAKVNRGPSVRRAAPRSRYVGAQRPSGTSLANTIATPA